MVISPTALTDEILTPAMIIGKAWGICILVNICAFVKPIPCAASMVAGEMLEIPVYVFFMIGSSEYSTTTTIAGAVPIPKNGIINPRSAILGIAWVTLVIPSTGLFNFLL